MTPEEFVDTVRVTLEQPKADPAVVIAELTKALADVAVVAVPVSLPPVVRLPPVVPGVVPDDPVNALLRESMATHRLYLEARRANDPNAKALLAKAYQLRLDANELDPEQDAEQWALEKQITEKTYSESINLDLLAFYHQMGATA
jgi:hypothetical protein